MHVREFRSKSRKNEEGSGNYRSPAVVSQPGQKTGADKKPALIARVGIAIYHAPSDRHYCRAGLSWLGSLKICASLFCDERLSQLILNVVYFQLLLSLMTENWKNL